MRVLIDGHNAISALRPRAASHEEQRLALLRRVASIRPGAIVYFDARNAPAGADANRKEMGLKVVYCRRREADEYILREVRQADDPGRVLVVSNDREVAGRAAQLGAQVVSVQEFFGRRPRRKSAPPRRPPRGRMRFTPEDFGLPDEIDLDDPDWEE